MRVLIEAHHPAHIHFFRNAIEQWQQQGVHVLLLGRDRDVMRRLLEAYATIPSEVISTIGRNNRFPLQEMLQRQAKVAARILSFKPDIVLSLMGSYTQSAGLLRVPNVIFTDSEFQHFNHRIAHPFATRIYTPECFQKDLGAKQRRYAGYHELAFLHPGRFTPNPEVLDLLQAKAGEYVVVRASAWDTLHDVGQVGFGDALDEFMELVLARYRVFVVPERGQISERWRPYVMNLPPHRFHDALAFARFVVTEGASTAAEAACLGVPSIYVNSTSRGYLDDMRDRYGLVSTHFDSRSALRQVTYWLREPPDAAALATARGRLIDEHIDVTDYIVREVNDLMR
jgi:predicted glycosyltransferase